MSSIEAQWAELCSQNERLVQQPERGLSSTDISPGDARSQWAELASQSERLADTTDPLFGLAISGRGTAAMRPVAGAA